MKKNDCQFCGIENNKIYEHWLKHVFFGYICTNCINTDFVINKLKKYNHKQTEVETMKRQTIIKNLYKKAQSKVVKLANGEYAINAGKGKHFLDSVNILESDTIQRYLISEISRKQYEIDIAYECLENYYPEKYETFGNKGKTTLGDLLA